MATAYEMGTPVREPKKRRMQSPLCVMDVGTVPATLPSNSASSEQPTSMTAMPALFADTLNPIKRDMTDIKEEVGASKGKVFENEHVMKIDDESMQNEINSISEDMKTMKVTAEMQHKHSKKILLLFMTN